MCGGLEVTATAKQAKGINAGIKIDSCHSHESCLISHGECIVLRSVVNI
jgi:hypothetical protein